MMNNDNLRDVQLLSGFSFHDQAQPDRELRVTIAKLKHAAATHVVTLCITVDTTPTFFTFAASDVPAFIDELHNLLNLEYDHDA